MRFIFNKYNCRWSNGWRIFFNNCSQIIVVNSKNRTIQKHRYYSLISLLLLLLLYYVVIFNSTVPLIKSKFFILFLQNIFHYFVCFNAGSCSLDEVQLKYSFVLESWISYTWTLCLSQFYCSNKIYIYCKTLNVRLQKMQKQQSCIKLDINSEIQFSPAISQILIYADASVFYFRYFIDQSN